jgi:hypothetical protein
VAAFVLPGISEATLIVTVFAELFADAAIAPKHTATRHATETAAVVAKRVDFIVTPFHTSRLR